MGLQKIKIKKKKKKNIFNVKKNKNKKHLNWKCTHTFTTIVHACPSLTQSCTYCVVLESRLDWVVLPGQQMVARLAFVWRTEPSLIYIQYYKWIYAFFFINITANFSVYSSTWYSIGSQKTLMIKMLKKVYTFVSELIATCSIWGV